TAPAASAARVLTGADWARAELTGCVRAVFTRFTRLSDEVLDLELFGDPAMRFFWSRIAEEEEAAAPQGGGREALREKPGSAVGQEKPQEEPSPAIQTGHRVSECPGGTAPRETVEGNWQQPPARSIMADIVKEEESRRDKIFARGIDESTGKHICVQCSNLLDPGTAPKARDVLAADTPRSGMYAAAHRGKHYVARKCAPANITPRSVLAVSAAANTTLRGVLRSVTHTHHTPAAAGNASSERDFFGMGHRRYSCPKRHSRQSSHTT
ncbi:hypothetical protein THAOC_28208, partial [Thalassiosira oceanica]